MSIGVVITPIDLTELADVNLAIVAVFTPILTTVVAAIFIAIAMVIGSLATAFGFALPSDLPLAVTSIFPAIGIFRLGTKLNHRSDAGVSVAILADKDGIEINRDRLGLGGDR
jgi:hypothetical protein